MKEIKTKWITKEKLPLVIEPTDKAINFPEFLRLLQEKNAFFREELLKNGALLFRNFPLTSADDFSDSIEALGLGKPLDYIGGDSPRNKIKGGVYTSTEAPPSIMIPLHNELSFIKNYPKHIYFYCHVAPEKKGETTLADARRVYHSMNEGVKQRLEHKQLKYVSHYYQKSPLMDLINKWQRSHKSWIEVLETSSKEEAERKCRENEFGFQWLKNNWLEISQVRPAFLTHPENNEKVWFNQAHLYDFNPRLLGFWRYLGAQLVYMRKHMRLHEVFYADGSPIPRKDLYHILDVLQSNTIYFPWQKGDFLVLDNVLTMHGRATFTGKRKIFAAMTG